MRSLLSRLSRHWTFLHAGLAANSNGGASHGQHAFPELTSCAAAAQFKDDANGRVVVMFELMEQDGEFRVVDERHYRLVPASEISADELRRFARMD